MFLNNIMVVQHSALLRKLALNAEYFYDKTIGWGLQNHVYDHETRKSGLFPCYRLKINDFLRSYNQNLKIDIFTPLQQIPCYCKSRLGTLRLILWWRVTFVKTLKTSQRAVEGKMLNVKPKDRLGDAFIRQRTTVTDS